MWIPPHVQLFLIRKDIPIFLRGCAFNILVVRVPLGQKLLTTGIKILISLLPRMFLAEKKKIKSDRIVGYWPENVAPVSRN